MMNEILEKQQRFIKKLAGNPQGKKKVNAVSKLQWIETSYALDGGRLNGEEVKTILTGRYVMTKTVLDHVTISNYAEMVNYLYSCLAIKDKVDLSLLCRANEILSKKETEGVSTEQFRKIVPIVSKIELVPIHPQDIARALEKTLQGFYAARDKLDPVMQACYIHNELLRIYPFEKNNEATARAMLNFQLLAANLPPIAFTMDTGIYYDAVIRHIKDEDPKPFYIMIAGVLNERLTQLLGML